MVDTFPRMESVKKTAELFGISEDAVRRMIHDGRITYIKIGKKYLINVDKLAALLNAGEAEE